MGHGRTCFGKTEEYSLLDRQLNQHSGDLSSRWEPTDKGGMVTLCDTIAFIGRDGSVRFKLVVLYAWSGVLICIGRSRSFSAMERRTSDFLSSTRP